MGTTISARGFDREVFEEDLRSFAKQIPGRLRHQIAHAQVVLEKDNEKAVDGGCMCTLRLRMYRAADVLVLARGADVCGALNGAFRRASYELLRRRRKMRYVSPGSLPALS